MRKRKTYYSRKLYNEHIITIKHESHSIAEWARRNGVRYRAVMFRMQKGTPPEVAVQKKAPRFTTTKRLANTKIFHVIWDGRLFVVRGDLLDEHPMRKEFHLKAVKQYRNSVKIAEPPKLIQRRIAKRYQITIDGVTKSARQWARVNGLQYSTVIRRVRDGFTLLEAVTLSTDEGKSRIPFLNGKIPQRITFEGQTHTLPRWARMSGWKYRLMRERLLNGWSFKEVMRGKRGPWYAKVQVNLRKRMPFTPLKQSVP